MSVIAFLVHRERSAAFELARDGADWLVERGHDVRFEPVDAELIGRPALAAELPSLMIGADLAVGVGGDGTILRAVDLAAEGRIPVLGVNAGQLGYLASVEPTGLRMALKRFLANSYDVDERMRLQVSGSALASPAFALNEVVLERIEPGHTVRIDVAFDGRDFTPYVADGLILATPTGSTAYSLSVRGPIVDPTHRAIVLSPVAPHMLFDRALVLEPRTVVTLSVGGHRAAHLSVDGRDGGAIEAGSSVDVTAAPISARLVRLGPSNFHDVLKAKFDLPER